MTGQRTGRFPPDGRSPGSVGMRLAAAVGLLALILGPGSAATAAAPARVAWSGQRAPANPPPAARPAAPPTAVPVGNPATPSASVGPGRGVSASVAAAAGPSPAVPIAAGVFAVLLAGGGAAVFRARRHRRTSTSADESIGPPPGVDIEALLAGLHAAHVRSADGRTSPQGHPAAGDDGGDPEAVEGPVWVRRLDDRIPIMPTIQTMPVDHDGERAPRRGVFRGRRAR